MNPAEMIGWSICMGLSLFIIVFSAAVAIDVYKGITK